MAGNIEELAVAAECCGQREGVGSDGGEESPLRDRIDFDFVRDAHEIEALAGNIEDDIDYAASERGDCAEGGSEARREKGEEK